MNQLVNPFQQADALDEVLLDVAALIELSPRDRRIAEKKLWLVERRRQGARPIDVEMAMADCRELQAMITATMSRTAFGKRRNK